VVSFDTQNELDAAEQHAKRLLDRMGARSTSKMESLFMNLADDGRTEMFDPANFGATLTELLNDETSQQLAGHEPDEPLWISDPRKEAARKAHLHPARNQKEAARKAVKTPAERANNPE